MTTPIGEARPKGLLGKFIESVAEDLKHLFVGRGKSSKRAAKKKAFEDSAEGKEKKSRWRRECEEREVVERARYLESVANLDLQIALLRETEREYRGLPGKDYKQPAHHCALEKLEGYSKPTPEELAVLIAKGLIVDDAYKAANILKTRRWRAKPTRKEEKLLTDSELEEVFRKDKHHVAGRHHDFRGASKIFAVKGNQQTVDALFNVKTGMVPVFEEDRLLPDPEARAAANAKEHKKRTRLWAPVKRIKADMLDMARRRVRLIPRPRPDLQDDINTLQQGSSILDGGGGSIATVTDLDEQSAAAYNFKQVSFNQPQRHEDEYGGDDDVDTNAGARSLFSEFSMGASRVHVPVKMVNMRTLRGLDGRKVKGLNLESLRSKTERSGVRKVIRSFNLKLASAIRIASKVSQDDLPPEIET